jgi:Flp pilus assembly protein TadG
MSRRTRLRRDERGQGMVEFAIVLPVFILLIVGLIEFGATYSGIISFRQGIREAGRQASVGTFGSNTTCPQDPEAPAAVPPGPNPNTIKIICMAKDQAGVKNSTAVYVKFLDVDLGTPGTYTVGKAILVCAVDPLTSITGLMKPLFNGRYAKSKAAFRIEKTNGTVTVGGDTDPTGQAWSWCK